MKKQINFSMLFLVFAILFALFVFTYMMLKG